MAELNIHTLALSPASSVASGQDPRTIPGGTPSRGPFPGAGSTQQARGPAGPVVTPPTLASDVLLGAQESRAPERVRAFDVRAAYGDRHGGQRTPGAATFTRDPDIPDAELIPTPASDTPTRTNPAIHDNVINLYGGPTSNGAGETSQAREAAHLAYVSAGGADGRVFITTGLDTARIALTARIDVFI